MTIFTFSADGGWQTIEDFLAVPDVSDCAEERALAGFSKYPALSVGDTEGGAFCVEIYGREFGAASRKQSQYEYLVAVDVGDSGEFIAIPSLPDLLEFMRLTIPLCVTIDDWRIRHEKYMAEIEEKLNSGRQK